MARIKRKCRMLLAGGSCLALLLLGAISPAWGEDAAVIVRVEEDWELQVGVPDVDGNAPEITLLLSCGGDLTGDYGILELNHASLPEYSFGGLQLQAWRGDTVFDHRTTVNDNPLMISGETISLTLSASITNANLVYEVSNGQSVTWGTFGGLGLLKSTVTTTLTDLNSYDPAVSAKYSKVNYASHRVQKLVRKEVRYYTADGLHKTDSEDVIVHQHESDVSATGGVQ